MEELDYLGFKGTVVLLIKTSTSYKYSREPEWRCPVTDIHGNNFRQQGSMSAISSISVEGKLFTLRASRRGHSDVDAHVWHDVPESGAIRRKVLYASTQLARTPFCVMRRAGASGIWMIVRAKRRPQQRQYRNLPAGRHDLISASDSKNKRPKDV